MLIDLLLQLKQKLCVLVHLGKIKSTGFTACLYGGFGLCFQLPMYSADRRTKGFITKEELQRCSRLLLKVLGRPLISLDFASEEPDLFFVIFQSVNSSPGSLKVLGRASL